MDSTICTLVSSLLVAGNTSGVLNEDLSDLLPETRMNNLEEYAKAVQLDYNVEPEIYFETGTKTMEKAYEFYKSGDFVNAYVFYLKYYELFRSKIKTHPYYNDVSLDYRSASSIKIYEASRKIKELRKKLLTMFQENYDAYVQEQQKRTSGSTKKLKVGWKTESDKRSSKLLSRSFSQAASFIKLTKEYQAFRTMKTIAIPNQTTTIFQIMVQRQSRYGIVSWGIIAGVWENNEYVVTHLIVPDAYSFRKMTRSRKSDECCKKYTEENDLITLGWIHIHKSSSIYMSCDDLHEQLNFQQSLPEAVSIICAPFLTQVGYFVLSEIGLEVLSQCVDEKRPHPHNPNELLYIPAKHIRTLYNHPLEVVDLRTHRTVEKYI